MISERLKGQLRQREKLITDEEMEACLACRAEIAEKALGVVFEETGLTQDQLQRMTSPEILRISISKRRNTFEAISRQVALNFLAILATYAPKSEYRQNH